MDGVTCFTLFMTLTNYSIFTVLYMLHIAFPIGSSQLNTIIMPRTLKLYFLSSEGEET